MSDEISIASAKIPEAPKKADLNSWGTNGRIGAKNNSSKEITLKSRTSMDSMHIMANSAFSIKENFLPEDSNAGLTLISYTGIYKGTVTTVQFLNGETLAGLKARTAKGG